MKVILALMKSKIKKTCLLISKKVDEVELVPTIDILGISKN